MSPKRKPQKPPPAKQEQAQKPTQKRQNVSMKTVVEKVSTPMGLLTLGAISSPVSQATLAPVFGSITSAVHHQQAVVATTLLGYLLWYIAPRGGPGSVSQYLAAWAFWIPVVQMYLFNYSGTLGPVAGPAIIGFLSCHTIIIPAAYAAAEASSFLNLSRRFGRYWAPLIVTGFGVLHMVSFERQFQSMLPGLMVLSQSFTPIKLQLLVASTLAYLCPSKVTFLGLPALVHTFVANPHFDSVRTFHVLNNSLATHDWTILERKWSNTGYISVLESKDMEYRIMRCDHSVLGGEWLLTEERKKQGWLVDEPVYSVFSMLEAVRLIENPHGVEDPNAKALIVGLGIGTAPKAFLSHGIDTTIVELDPVVHQYAQTYFNLPQNHTAILQNAVPWAADMAEYRTTKYDYIIHDVFTGGAEPLQLFTQTFIQNLRTLLTPHGAIALNYAGDVNFPLTAKVLNTIDLVFNGQCKIFRDTPDEGDKSAVNEDFTNIIIFCLNTPGPITFRKPTKADLLGSKSRGHYMLPDPKNEMTFPLEGSAKRQQRLQSEALRVGDEQGWAAQQADSAKKHWYVMREVMPDAVWELW
jgi:hypothetical protein